MQSVFISDGAKRYRGFANIATVAWATASMFVNMASHYLLTLKIADLADRGIFVNLAALAFA